MITDQSGGFISLFEFYKKGQLCLSGGVLEQPAKYIESMRIIEIQVNSGK